MVGAVLVTAGRSAVYLRIGLAWPLMLALTGAALLVAPWLLGRRQATHTSSLGLFTNSMHFWSVQLFFVRRPGT